MKIRPATRDDLPQLLRLYGDLNPGEPEIPVGDAQERLEGLWRYPGSDILVASVDGRLVSTCTLVVVPNLTRGGAPYALIENVVTAADQRGRGYGKAVLREAVEAAWRAGCYKAMLLTGSSRPETHAFYRAAGFEQNKTGFQVRRIPPRG